MIIPVRCFSCNGVVGHLWKPFNEMVAEYQKEDAVSAVEKALEDVGLPPEKLCCRRMLMTHVNVIDELLLFSNNPGEKVVPEQVLGSDFDTTDIDPEPKIALEEDELDPDEDDDGENDEGGLDYKYIEDYDGGGDYDDDGGDYDDGGGGGEGAEFYSD